MAKLEHLGEIHKEPTEEIGTRQWKHDIMGSTKPQN